jgi:hypothetical protein
MAAGRFRAVDIQALAACKWHFSSLSGAHVPLSTFRSGSRKTPFSARHSQNLLTNGSDELQIS